MASIMQGTQQPSAPAPKHVNHSRTQTQKPQPAEHVQPSPKQPSPPVAQYTAPKKSRRFPTKAVLSLATFSAVMVGGFFLWNGPISALLTPPSPFKPEIALKMDTPLYYPTKLPGTYKMETNSIAQPESSVVVYAITDEEGKKINVSLQKQPKGLTLDPLYQVLSDLKEVETKFGTLKYGASEDGVDIVNILTGETWIIITSNKGLLSQEEVQLLTNNLRTN